MRVVGKEGALGGADELGQRHGWLRRDNNEAITMLGG